jgi:hypothetical protein
MHSQLLEQRQIQWQQRFADVESGMSVFFYHHDPPTALG